MQTLDITWYVPHQIAGGPMPRSFEAVGELVTAGIGAIVHLVEVHDRIGRCLKTAELKRHHLPVELAADGTVAIPPDDVLRRAAQFVRTSLDAKRAVYVHCDTGNPRTSYLIALLGERYLWPLGREAE